MLIYDGFQLNGCRVSEKYDGICAIWDGSELTTRDGNRINAPDWFVAGLPSDPLRGELWCGRGQFEMALSICMSQNSGERWKAVRLMVFNVPARAKEFGQFAEAVNWFAVKEQGRTGCRAISDCRWWWRGGCRP